MNVLDMLQRLGHRGLSGFAESGRATLLLLSSLKTMPFQRRIGSVFVQQIFSVGVLSLLIILVSGLFIGMVLGLQGYEVLVDYGAEGSLGPMVSLSLLRELGPVVTALLFAGRAGSALTAEIGLMKATEQLSGLEMMAVDPLKRVVAPRFWAGVLCMPLLTMLFCVVGIWGGKMVGVDWLGLDQGSYWSLMHSAVQFDEDIMNMLIKSIVFAVVVTWVAVFKGYDATPTSEGISRATTQTVVTSSLAVLGVDFLLTAMMFG